LPPLLLLATLVAARLETGPQTTERGPQLAGRVWRGVFAVLGIVALAATVRLVAGLAGFDGGIGRANAWRPWAFLAVGAAIPLIVEVTHAGGRTLRTRAMLLLAVLLAGQPVLHDVVWPRRVANDSQRATAKRIDELVPAGERLYVLGNHEYHDVAIYADTPFEFAKSADDALVRATASGHTGAWAIYREEEADELVADTRAELHRYFTFVRTDKENVCVRIVP
jgi:hypothetical protein